MTTKTLLAILQQSEYDIDRLRKWLEVNADQEMDISPEKWTTKLKIVNFFTLVLFFLPALVSFQIALTLLAPFENTVRQYYYTRAGWKLWWYKLRGLKVIAVAGSYGKTSTKNILYHCYQELIPTLVTPKSINTKLGIAQDVLSELTAEHKLYVVEFGEYHPHDIPQLTQFVKPDYGILTPLGRQHLELLGSFEQVVKTFTHFVEFFNRKPEKLLIAAENKPYFTTKSPLYGTAPECAYRVFNTKITRAGTEYEFIDRLHNVSAEVFIPLFGEHQAVNTLPALWLATQLQYSQAEVVKRLRTLPYISRRHEPSFGENNILILDNSYNSNPDSVKESLKLVNQLEPSNRLIVTMGFAEMGDESQKIHFEFGQQLAQHMDYVGLIEAPWSQAIIDGFIKAGGQKDHIFVGKTQENAFEPLQQYILPGSIVLFEGGYQEVYLY